MEEKIVKILKIANELNEKQNSVYAQITYTADASKTLEISIRSKDDFSYIEQCKLQLRTNSILSLDSFIELFKKYIGGAVNE